MEAVSYTAQWTAAARALENERPDRIFTDPFARTIAGEKGFFLLDRYSGAGTAQYVVVRTKYMDDAIVRAVTERDIRQVVLVAAGMDARAARLPWPPGVTLYELDRPGLFEVKSQTLPKAGYEPACTRRTVAVDLAGEWMPAVLEAGLDVSQPVLWVAEGLFFFLPEEAVQRLLTVVRGSAVAGSVFIGDFVSHTALVNPLARGFLRLLEEDGNPWRFGTDDPEGFLSEAGWRVTDLKQPGEPGASFDRWPFPVPGREIASAPRSFMFTAEAN